MLPCRAFITAFVTCSMKTTLVVLQATKAVVKACSPWGKLAALQTSYILGQEHIRTGG